MITKKEKNKVFLVGLFENYFENNFWKQFLVFSETKLCLVIEFLKIIFVLKYFKRKKNVWLT